MISVSLLIRRDKSPIFFSSLLTPSKMWCTSYSPCFPSVHHMSIEDTCTLMGRFKYYPRLQLIGRAMTWEKR